MSTLAQAKFENLRLKNERELILNEILKGTVVRWVDVMAVFGEKIATARNKILALPAQYADRLTREEVEDFRKAIYKALMEAADVSTNEVKAKNASVKKFVKAGIDEFDLNKESESVRVTKSTAIAVRKV